jgi:mRNA interferase RelE/StbE
VASYRVLIKRSAAREIEAVPLKDRRRIVARIEGLAKKPRPVGCEKLSGEEKYRIRQGDYRILYEIVDTDLIVTAGQSKRKRSRQAGGVTKKNASPSST